MVGAAAVVAIVFMMTESLYDQGGLLYIEYHKFEIRDRVV